MESSPAFKSKDVVSICSYLERFCTDHINHALQPAPDHASALHAFLPSLLACIFGAPKARGWMQTVLTSDQLVAVRKLLAPSGAFVTALTSLSGSEDYKYYLSTDKLPEDIRRALTTGATGYLPRVYRECVFLDESKVSTVLDYRAAATRQASVFPVTNTGEHRIRFSMIQFYLYYMVSTATWQPPTPPPAPLISSLSSTTSHSSSTGSYSTSTTSTTSTNGNAHEPAFLLTGKIQALKDGVYLDLIQQYMNMLMPFVANDAAPLVPRIGYFFQDLLVEIWVRSQWVASGQKWTMDQVMCVAALIKFITSADLRRGPVSKPESTFGHLYQQLKHDYYLMISRCAHNWARDDSYICVLYLWSLWACPWQLGTIDLPSVPPKSKANMVSLLNKSRIEHAPLDEGYALFMLDNACFYIPLVDVFLQRMASLTFADRPVAATAAPSASLLPSASASASATTTPSMPVTRSAMQPMASSLYSAPRTSPLTAPYPSSAFPTPNGTPRTQPAPGPQQLGPLASNQPTRAPPPSPWQTSSLYGELYMVHLIAAVWRTRGVVPVLALIEDGTDAYASSLPSEGTQSTDSALAAFFKHTRAKINSYASKGGASSQLHGAIAALTTLTSITDTKFVATKINEQHDWMRALQGTSTPWKPSRLYSAKHTARQESLIKLMDTLALAIRKRQPQQSAALKKIATASTWAPFGPLAAANSSSANKEDTEAIVSVTQSIASSLQIPIPDAPSSSPSTLKPSSSTLSSTSSSSTAGSTISHQTSASTTALPAAKTSSDLHARKQPAMREIRPLGPRADTSVRSYELACLLIITYTIDGYIKKAWKTFHAYYPWRSKLPVQCPISVRILAAPVNLFYFVLLPLFLLIVWCLYI
ncbi:hypothetical protein BC940DRAFT_292636 [Gongronella butleri]|nr:hypothetical protein BC940DRAFT_292636 [Gongronella butleri]